MRMFWEVSISRALTTDSFCLVKRASNQPPLRHKLDKGHLFLIRFRSPSTVVSNRVSITTYYFKFTILAEVLCLPLPHPCGLQTYLQNNPAIREQLILLHTILAKKNLLKTLSSQGNYDKLGPTCYNRDLIRKLSHFFIE